MVDLGMVLSHASRDSGHGMVDCFAPADHAQHADHDHDGAPSHPPHISLKARRLLLFACDMGWAGVAARVLPLATGACACATELVDAVHASSAPPQALAAPMAKPSPATAAAPAPPPPPHEGCCGCCSGGRHCGRASCRCAEFCSGGDGPTSHRRDSPNAAAAAATAAAAVAAAAAAPAGGCCAAKHAATAPPPALEEQPPHAAVTASAASAGQWGGKGLSLLHRVVRSGNLSLLQGVLHWGAVAGYAWRADRNGPGGLTPLHLAALQVRRSPFSSSWVPAGRGHGSVQNWRALCS